MKERIFKRLDNNQFTYITLKIHSDEVWTVFPYFLLCFHVALLHEVRRRQDLRRPSRSRSFFGSEFSSYFNIICGI